MTIHMICIHVLFFLLIYDAFCPWLCLSVHAPDEVIIHETTLNQVFVDNFMIFIQIYHVVDAYFTRTVYCLFFLTWSVLCKLYKDIIYETLREMCPIVNHVWTYFTKTIYFCVAILCTNICFHVI
jgi:hypothetical protein